MQVIAGRYHSFAVSDDGRVFSWGLNDYGQLGRPAVLAGGETCHSGPTCFDGRPRQLEHFQGAGLRRSAPLLLLSVSPLPPAGQAAAAMPAVQRGPRPAPSPPPAPAHAPSPCRCLQAPR